MKTGMPSSLWNRTFLKNFASLSVLQVSNYILPLIVLPYLVRVIGPEKYGLIAFAQALCQYFAVITDYGFWMSASREIAINRDDEKKVSETFSSVIAAQFLLMSACFLVLCAMLLFIPRFRNDSLVYLFTFGTILGSIMFPNWFFMGKERMEFMAVRDILVKIVFTVLIFVFVRKTEHYIYVPIINFFGYMCVGLLSVWTLVRKFRIRVRVPRISDIVSRLKNNRHIFVSAISLNFYFATNTFFLGIFTNNTIVGFYAAAEKIIITITQIFNPLFNAAYPYIAKLANESKEKALEKVKRISVITIAASSAIFAVFLALSDGINLLILGPRFADSAAISRILSPVLVTLPAVCLLANVILVPFRLERPLSGIYVRGWILNTIALLIVLGIFRAGAAGVALTNVTVQASLALAMLLAVKRYGVIRSQTAS
ncbi:MAG: oligosaccharide flippase family protein [Candidatus Omnitrophota bacterium]